jgi:hypothetical protein
MRLTFLLLSVVSWRGAHVAGDARRSARVVEHVGERRLEGGARGLRRRADENADATGEAQRSGTWAGHSPASRRPTLTGYGSASSLISSCSSK